jgi:hypothetical protein
MCHSPDRTSTAAQPLNPLMDITQTIALTMGVAWASGINLYATILVLGYMGMTGNIDLPPDLEILADPLVMVAAAGLVGGTLATGSHATKAGSRVLINTSPEPVSNWFASVGEDVAVILGLWTALNNPVLFLVLLGVFILLMIWLLPRIWRGIRKLFAWLRQRLGSGSPPAIEDRPTDAGDRPRT